MIRRRSRRLDVSLLPFTRVCCLELLGSLAKSVPGYDEESLSFSGGPLNTLLCLDLYSHRPCRVCHHRRTSHHCRTTPRLDLLQALVLTSANQVVFIRVMDVIGATPLPTQSIHLNILFADRCLMICEILPEVMPGLCCLELETYEAAWILRCSDVVKNQGSQAVAG